MNIKDIRDLDPCYDPVKYLSEDWEGSLLDILDVEDCPVVDKLWVVLKLLPDDMNKLFALDCLKTYLTKAEAEEKFAARSAAGFTAGSAAGDAAWFAALAAGSDARGERERQLEFLKNLIREKI